MPSFSMWRIKYKYTDGKMYEWPFDRMNKKIKVNYDLPFDAIKMISHTFFFFLFKLWEHTRFSFQIQKKNC